VVSLYMFLAFSSPLNPDCYIGEIEIYAHKGKKSSTNSRKVLLGKWHVRASYSRSRAEETAYFENGIPVMI
jgi:hypothetical protein